MAKIENKDIIEALKEKTILEVKELVDMMKEEFGAGVKKEETPKADKKKDKEKEKGNAEALLQ